MKPDDTNGQNTPSEVVAPQVFEPAGTAGAEASQGATQAEAIEAGMFLALAAYGIVSDDDKYAYNNDYRSFIEGQEKGSWNLLTTDELGTDGFDDNHGFEDGGLYVGFSGSEVNGAEALAAEVTINGEEAIVLSFRGSDGRDSALQAQTFSAEGAAQYYNELKPLIVEVLEYAIAEGIDQVIVSGHSLGGTMVDIFTLTDAEAFIAAGIDLTVVSVASAGIPPDLPEELDLNDEYLELSESACLDWANQLASTGTTITAVNAPDWYVGITHTQDAVHYPGDIPPSFAPFYLLSRPLLNNVTFDSSYDINLPGVENTDTNSIFGAEHDGGMYWVNVQALTNDSWFDEYSEQTIIMGNSNYSEATDYGGTPLPNPPDYFGKGDSDLLGGTTGDEYILGLSGSDMIFGHAGADLISGGAGRDRISGGLGADNLDGGEAADRLSGGAGGDIIRSQGDGDVLSGGSGADSFEFVEMTHGARITDFQDGNDLIDLTALAEGFDQVSITNSARGAVIEVAGTTGQILVVGVSADSLTEEDFAGFAPPEDPLLF